MAIVFHCSHCGRKIEAADSVGGKWGKCPSCHNKLYVPDLNADGDIKLAPIDETEEEHRKRLMAETYRITQDILQERVVPEGPVDAEAAPPAIPEAASPGGPAPKISDADLTRHIIKHLRLMADGRLGEAETTFRHIRPHGRQAMPILDRIALSDMPEPELADVPQQVLSGLIRTLRVKLTG